MSENEVSGPATFIFSIAPRTLMDRLRLCLRFTKGVALLFFIGKFDLTINSENHRHVVVVP